MEWDARNRERGNPLSALPARTGCASFEEPRQPILQGLKPFVLRPFPARLKPCPFKTFDPPNVPSRTFVLQPSITPGAFTRCELSTSRAISSSLCQDFIPHKVQPDDLGSFHGFIEVAVDGALCHLAQLFGCVPLRVTAVS